MLIFTCNRELKQRRRRRRRLRKRHLKIEGGLKNIFSALLASVWYKNRGWGICTEIPWCLPYCTCKIRSSSTGRKNGNKRDKWIKVNRNIEVGPNRNGPFHLISKQNFQNFGLNGKHSRSLCMFLPLHNTGFAQIFGSKLQDFFHTFFQTNNFFFQTQGHQTGDQYEQSLFHDAL